MLLHILTFAVLFLSPVNDNKSSSNNNNNKIIIMMLTKFKILRTKILFLFVYQF